MFPQSKPGAGAADLAVNGAATNIRFTTSRRRIVAAHRISVTGSVEIVSLSFARPAVRPAPSSQIHPVRIDRA